MAASTSETGPAAGPAGVGRVAAVVAPALVAALPVGSAPDDVRAGVEIDAVPGQVGACASQRTFGNRFSPGSAVRGLLEERHGLAAIRDSELLNDCRNMGAHAARLELQPLGDVTR